MSLEEMGIKDVTPKNSVGMGMEVRAELKLDGGIADIMVGESFVGTLFDPELFFKSEDGSFLLRSNDAFIRVQEVKGPKCQE